MPPPHARDVDDDEQQLGDQHAARIDAHAFAIEPVRKAVRAGDRQFRMRIGGMRVTSEERRFHRVSLGANDARRTTTNSTPSSTIGPICGSFISRFSISKIGSSHASTITG